MNPFDLFAVLLLVGAVLLGYRSGALPQVGGLLGAAAGGVIVILLLPVLEGPLDDLQPGTRALVVLGGLILAVGGGEALGSAAGRTAGRRLGEGMLGTLDRVAGSFVGAAQAILIVWLAGGLLATGPVPRLAAAAQTSTAVRALDGLLPPPTAIAANLGRLLDDSGLPSVFIGLEPVPAPPVDRPDDPTARRIADRAEVSTVKVTAAACLNVSSGSGFVVADDYVVTNAHVVAGASEIRVAGREGLRDAVPVLFDPALDVAVLHVRRLDAPILRFARAEPERGERGAALGFPGGGSLAVIPAAVADGYDAQGRDIYGANRVTRRILELRAAIERGDSGGPLVLADGTIGGVVFAEARSDEDVGYALSGPPVAAAIAPSIGRTSAVDTGVCID
ncbi:MAG TPA: MarP family serine protease [Candidatus Limnocylindrales bacterium]